MSGAARVRHRLPARRGAAIGLFVLSGVLHAGASVGRAQPAGQTRVAVDWSAVSDADVERCGLSRLRDEVAERIDAGTVLSRRRTAFAHDCAELFRTIDEGDEDIGVPPYNGGLFSDRNETTAPPDRALLPDADFAPLLDRLARTEKDGRRVRINFRDLSV